MATVSAAEFRADVHRIEPVSESDRDSTGPQQMWIWAGANIAPINWALGALGIVLKLGLWETIVVVVLGNIVGCAIFAAFPRPGLDRELPCHRPPELRGDLRQRTARHVRAPLPARAPPPGRHPGHREAGCRPHRHPRRPRPRASRGIGQED